MLPLFAFPGKRTESRDIIVSCISVHRACVNLIRDACINLIRDAACAILWRLLTAMESTASSRKGSDYIAVAAVVMGVAGQPSRHIRFTTAFESA